MADGKVGIGKLTDYSAFGGAMPGAPAVEVNPVSLPDRDGMVSAATRLRLADAARAPGALTLPGQAGVTIGASPVIAAPRSADDGKATTEELSFVHFGFDSAAIAKSDERMLGFAALLLKGNPSSRATLYGYADDIGSRKYNMDLSLRRAMAVRDFLHGKGIPFAQISVVGLGSAQPPIVPKHPPGRAGHRLVMVRIEGFGEEPTTK